MNPQVTEALLMCSDNNVFITATLFLPQSVNTNAVVKLDAKNLLRVHLSPHKDGHSLKI